MKLIVGLGNPGAKYARTRHNVGYLALDNYAAATKLSFSQATKRQAQVAEFRDSAGEIVAIVAKPLTLMNHSGQAVAALANYYKINTDAVAVIYDELALPFGMVRIREGGTSAGHNGVESIIKHLGDGFTRIRIGIANSQLTTSGASEFVLSKFRTEELAALTPILNFVDHQIERFIQTGNLAAHTEIIGP